MVTGQCGYLVEVVGPKQKLHRCIGDTDGRAVASAVCLLGVGVGWKPAGLQVVVAFAELEGKALQWRL